MFACFRSRNAVRRNPKTLQEFGNGDAIFDVKKVRFPMAKDFYDQVKPIMVGYDDSAKDSKFSISSVAYRFNLQA